MRRRRQCRACSHRFTTFERIDEVPLVVVKSNGRTEPFERAKIVAGIAAATKGRGIDADALERSPKRSRTPCACRAREVTSAQIGVTVLDRLRSIDEVAYLRFASVYKNFDAAADFHRELELLEQAGTPSA